MKKHWTTFLLGAIVVGAVAGSAIAIPPFNKEWVEKYKEGNSDAKFVEAADAAKCNVCHVGKSKKDKNEYGKAVGKYLNKKDYEAVKGDPDKAKKYIVEGLDKAAEEKDSNGKSFGERLKAGDLPQ